MSGNRSYVEAMSDVVAAILIGLMFSAAILWKIRENRRRGNPVHDETLRAGEPATDSAETAAQHALDKTAWTRISGP